MQITGEWHLFDDRAVRPVVWARIAPASTHPVLVPLLVDTGADHTVLAAHLLPDFRDVALPPTPALSLVGVGGNAPYRLLRASLAFARDDGQPVTVRGEFAILTDPESSDLSVLGRDVLDNFTVIVDRPGGRVLLLAPRHAYRIEVT